MYPIPGSLRLISSQTIRFVIVSVRKTLHILSLAIRNKINDPLLKGSLTIPEKGLNCYPKYKTKYQWGGIVGEDDQGEGGANTLPISCLP